MNNLSKNLHFLRKKNNFTLSQIADIVGKGHNTISNWEKGINEPTLSDIYKVCRYYDILLDDITNKDLENVSLNYFPKGFKDSKNVSLNVSPSVSLNVDKYTEANIVNEPEEAYGKPNAVHNSIPLVSLKAVAGFGNGTVCLEKSDIKEHYVIPKFKNKKIDFLIEMEGDSMATTYSNGDVLACTIISEQSFIQWNRVYIVCTKDQGLIVKRVRQSEKEGCYLMVSDNSDYAPFNVPISLIDSIALVQGGVWSE